MERGTPRRLAVGADMQPPLGNHWLPLQKTIAPSVGCTQLLLRGLRLANEAEDELRIAELVPHVRASWAPLLHCDVHLLDEGLRRLVSLVAQAHACLATVGDVGPLIVVEHRHMGVVDRLVEARPERRQG